MSGARHPKPYKDGKAQVTVPWKRRVLEKLEKNKKASPQIRPSNIDQLADIVGAKKGSLNRLLDLETDQLSSSFALEISEVLDVLPPVLEEDGDDPDFARDVTLLRSIDPSARRDLMLTASRLQKKR